jgi:hypothetical protein
LIETVIDRDDVHWNTVVVPAVEAFVCDIRRLIFGTDADANQELVKEVLAAAREVRRETTAGTAEVPAVAAEVLAVAPAIAPTVTTLLHDLRIVLRGRGLAPAGGSIALKQQLQLVRQSPTTNIIRVHAMDGGGECVGTLNRALSCHLAPLLDAGFASGDSFAATATVIGMPPPDSAAAATKPALLSVTLRGSLTLLPEVGKFVTALASVASAAAAAAAPTGTPAAAAVSDTAAAAASTAASTAADATAAVTTKKRKSPPVEPQATVQVNAVVCVNAVICSIEFKSRKPLWRSWLAHRSYESKVVRSKLTGGKVIFLQCKHIQCSIDNTMSSSGHTQSAAFCVGVVGRGATAALGP